MSFLRANTSMSPVILASVATRPKNTIDKRPNLHKREKLTIKLLRSENPLTMLNTFRPWETSRIAETKMRLDYKTPKMIRKTLYPWKKKKKKKIKTLLSIFRRPDRVIMSTTDSIKIKTKLRREMNLVNAKRPIKIREHQPSDMWVKIYVTSRGLLSNRAPNWRLILEGPLLAWPPSKAARNCRIVSQIFKIRGGYSATTKSW